MVVVGGRLVTDGGLVRVGREVLGRVGQVQALLGRKVGKGNGMNICKPGCRVYTWVWGSKTSELVRSVF